MPLWYVNQSYPGPNCKSSHSTSTEGTIGLLLIKSVIPNFAHCLWNSRPSSDQSFRAIWKNRTYHGRLFSMVSSSSLLPWLLCFIFFFLKLLYGDFPGGPVVKSSPSSVGGAGSIPGWGARIPHTSRPKNQNIKQKQYCNKFNKDFKNGPHQEKKKNLKKVRKTHVWFLLPFF